MTARRLISTVTIAGPAVATTIATPISLLTPSNGLVGHDYNDELLSKQNQAHNEQSDSSADPRPAETEKILPARRC